MSGQTFRPGELVRFSGEGVVQTFSVNESLTIRTGDGRDVFVPTDSRLVTVERVAPAWWPPKAGYLIQDGIGDLHFCIDSPNVMDPTLYDQAGEDRWASRVLAERAPLELIHPSPSGAVSSREIPPPPGGDWLVQPGPRIDEALADDSTQVLQAVTDAREVFRG